MDVAVIKGYRITLSLCSIVLLLSFCLLQNTQGATYSVPDTNIVLTYEVADGKASITDCNTDASGMLTIPNTLGGAPVTKISKYAVSGCRLLTSVSLPDSITDIGESAFYYSTSLVSVAIPGSTVMIGARAFDGTAITYDYEINGLKYLLSSGGKKAFLVDASNATGEVIIPDTVAGVAVFGIGAFYSNENVTSVTLPNSITSIGSLSFRSCSSLASINVDNANLSYSSAGGVLFNKDKSTLITYPAGKSGAYVIPEGVTSIVDGAFYYCSFLKSVSIPYGVTSIGTHTFYACFSLTSITIPDSIIRIGYSAFYGCWSLTAITIPDSVTHIEYGAFGECRFTHVIIPSSVISMGDGVFNENSVTSIAFQGNAPENSGGIATFQYDEGLTIYHWDSATGFGSYPWTQYNVVSVDTTDPGIANWRKLSTIPAEASMSDDLNGDAVSLLMAYALNLNPDEQLTGKMPQGELYSITDSFSISYFAGRTDISYTVECSPDLSAWSTIGISHTLPDAEGRVNSYVPVEDNESMFLRLSVEEL